MRFSCRRRILGEVIRRSLQSAVELERPLSVMQRLEVLVPIAVIVFVFLLAMATTAAAFVIGSIGWRIRDEKTRARSIASRSVCRA